jgi:hypothetical protein
MDAALRVLLAVANGTALDHALEHADETAEEHEVHAEEAAAEAQHHAEEQLALLAAEADPHAGHGHGPSVTVSTQADDCMRRRRPAVAGCLVAPLLNSPAPAPEAAHHTAM